MSVKLHVGNISFKTTDQVLTDLFATIGSVTSCEIVRDSVAGRSRGFGFVEMASKAESENAIAQIDGRTVDGRVLTVHVARPKQSRGFGEIHGQRKMNVYSGDPRAAI